MGSFLEQAVLGSLDGERMLDDVTAISECERVAGTPGEEKAVRYIVDRLEAEGLPVQVVTFESYVSCPLEGALQVVGPCGWSASDVITHSFSADTGEGPGVEGEVVYLPGADLVDFPRPQVQGKILLADGLAMPPRVWAAEQAGTLGRIYASAESVPHDLIVSVVWGAPTPATVDAYPGNPVVSIGAGEAQKLRDLVARLPRLRVRLRARAPRRWQRQYLPVARLDPPGIDGAPYLLVGGHYCSWYRGATDNATGDAAIMELARIFHRSRGRLFRGVLFAWWPGHTHGRYSGSTWFCDHFWRDLVDRCVGYFNIDSPGVKHATLYRPTVMAEAEDWLKEVIHGVAGQSVPVRRPGKFSDESFWGIGFPSWCIYTDMPEGTPERGQVGGSAGGWFWHTAHDTLDKVDGGQLLTDTALFATCMARLLDSPLLPFRPAALARDVTAALAEIRSLAEDWSPLASVESDAAAFYRAALRVENALAGSRHEGRQRPGLDRCLMALSREINPVLYTRNGRYEQDLAVPTPLLPSLRRLQEYRAAGPTTHAGRVLETYLVRQCNRLGDSLRRGTGLIESALANLPPDET